MNLKNIKMKKLHTKCIAMKIQNVYDFVLEVSDCKTHQLRTRWGICIERFNTQGSLKKNNVLWPHNPPQIIKFMVGVIKGILTAKSF